MNKKYIYIKYTTSRAGLNSKITFNSELPDSEFPHKARQFKFTVVDQLILYIFFYIFF